MPAVHSVHMTPERQQEARVAAESLGTVTRDSQPGETSEDGGSQQPNRAAEWDSVNKLCHMRVVHFHEHIFSCGSS